MIVARPPARWPLAAAALRWPLVAAVIAASVAGGGLLLAQLSPGDRGVAPIDSSSNLEVTNVLVDVSAKSAEAARMGGWREAQRKAWKVLYARIRGVPIAAAPGLPDGTLDSIVAGIEVEDEQIGPTRYVARLGVLFDRARAAGYLGGAGEALIRSPPGLVLPIEY